MCPQVSHLKSDVQAVKTSQGGQFFNRVQLSVRDPHVGSACSVISKKPTSSENSGHDLTVLHFLFSKIGIMSRVGQKLSTVTDAFCGNMPISMKFHLGGKNGNVDAFGMELFDFSF